MEGAHPSMPNTLDGYGILAQAEMRGACAESVWFRGTITKALKGWEEGGWCTFCYLQINTKVYIYGRDRVYPPIYFVLPFILTNKKKPRIVYAQRIFPAHVTFIISGHNIANSR